MNLPNKQKGFLIPLALLIIAAVSFGFSLLQNERITNLENPPQTLSGSQAAADFSSSLASEITAAATTMTLVSTSTPSGEHLTQGQVYAFKLGGREYVKGTLSAGRQITSMTRGLSQVTGTTTVAASAEPWGRGTSVEITDAPLILEINNKISGTQYFDNLLTYTTNHSVSSSTNQIPYASWVVGQTNTASTSAYRTILNSANTFSLANTFSATTTFSQGATLGYSIDSGSDALDVANKSYVDSVAIAGASDASQTVKGIVEEATVPEINSASATGGTGAKLFMTPLAFSHSNFASSSVTHYATTSGSQYLAKTFQMKTGQTAFVWASAMAGATNANYSLTRFAYKWATDTATTTLASDGEVSFDYDTFFHILQASTTNTVTVELATTNANPDFYNIGAYIINP